MTPRGPSRHAIRPHREVAPLMLQGLRNMPKRAGGDEFNEINNAAVRQQLLLSAGDDTGRIGL